MKNTPPPQSCSNFLRKGLRGDLGSFALIPSLVCHGVWSCTHSQISFYKHSVNLSNLWGIPMGPFKLIFVASHSRSAFLRFALTQKKCSFIKVDYCNRMLVSRKSGKMWMSSGSHRHILDSAFTNHMHSTSTPRITWWSMNSLMCMWGCVCMLVVEFG